MAYFLPTLSRFLDKATDWTVSLMAVLAITCLVLQVFSRYVLQSTFSWTEEIALFLFAWIVLLSTASLVKGDRHVRIDVITPYVPLTIKRILVSSTNVVTLLFFSAMVWVGINYILRTSGQTTAVFKLPLELLYLALPTCGMIGSIHTLCNITNNNERC